jgi:hypothetical protein
MRKLVAILVALSPLVAPSQAFAWGKPGHMVTAAIAYDDLAAHSPSTLTRVLQILAQHPDAGRFDAAATGATGRTAAIRRLMECARWPDDARGTAFDHPTWHYSDTPVVRPGAPADAGQQHGGDAIDAVQFGLYTAANTRAPMSERALALCWVMHVAGDLHQPLHAASLYSDVHPHGDAGGNDDYIVDPASGRTTKLHAFWDNVAFNTDTPDAAVAEAQQLEARYARTSLPELHAFQAPDVPGWTRGETFALAQSDAYVAGVDTGGEQTPVTLPQGYGDHAKQIAERRLAIAGYRLADLLRLIATR